MASRHVPTPDQHCDDCPYPKADCQEVHAALLLVFHGSASPAGATNTMGPSMRSTLPSRRGPRLPLCTCTSHSPPSKRALPEGRAGVTITPAAPGCTPTVSALVMIARFGGDSRSSGRAYATCGCVRGPSARGSHRENRNDRRHRPPARVARDERVADCRGRRCDRATSSIPNDTTKSSRTSRATARTSSPSASHRACQSTPAEAERARLSTARPPAAHVGRDMHGKRGRKPKLALSMIVLPVGLDGTGRGTHHHLAEFDRHHLHGCAVLNVGAGARPGRESARRRRAPFRSGAAPRSRYRAFRAASRFGSSMAPRARRGHRSLHRDSPVQGGAWQNRIASTKPATTIPTRSRRRTRPPSAHREDRVAKSSGSSFGRNPSTRPVNPIAAPSAASNPPPHHREHLRHDEPETDHDQQQLEVLDQVREYWARRNPAPSRAASPAHKPTPGVFSSKSRKSTRESRQRGCESRERPGRPLRSPGRQIDDVVRGDAETLVHRVEVGDVAARHAELHRFQSGQGKEAVGTAVDEDLLRSSRSIPGWRARNSGRSSLDDVVHRPAGQGDPEEGLPCARSS